MTDAPHNNSHSVLYLTGYINDHYIGIAVPLIQDVIGPHGLTRIPLAENAIAGVLNLRGRIVTAIDMHRRLQEDGCARAQGMGIIIEWRDELFSLLIDRVEDVMAIPAGSIEKAPPTLNPLWQGICGGVYAGAGRIMIILDIEKILDFEQGQAA